MAPVRFERAFRWSIMVAALAGSLAAVAPGAFAQGRNDLDYMSYGQPGAVAAPAPGPDGGGAIAALRRAFSGGTYMAAPQAYVPPPVAAPGPVVIPAPVAVAPAPVVIPAPYEAGPVRYDAGYQLDAGDKLRVVVYGQ